jgi:hypothetical protein
MVVMLNPQSKNLNCHIHIRIPILIPPIKISDINCPTPIVDEVIASFTMYVPEIFFLDTRYHSTAIKSVNIGAAQKRTAGKSGIKYSMFNNLNYYT